MSTDTKKTMTLKEFMTHGVDRRKFKSCTYCYKKNWTFEKGVPSRVVSTSKVINCSWKDDRLSIAYLSVDGRVQGTVENNVFTWQSNYSDGSSATLSVGFQE